MLVCTGYHVTEQFHTKATFIATNYGVLNFGAGTQNIKTDQPHVCLCRAYCMMKTSGSCVRVYQDRTIIDMERWELKPLRNEAWQHMLSQQRTIFPFWFQVVWCFWLIGLFSCCIGINVYDMVMEGNFIIATIAIGFDGLGLIMWITFVIINFIRYKPVGNEVKGESRVVSYFYMEQIQQFLSELCIYPQLCISCMLLLTNYNTISGIPFYLCSVSLVFVLSCRLCTIVKIRRFITVFYFRLMLFAIGSFAVVSLWLATLIVYTWPSSFDSLDIFPEVASRSILCIFILFNTPLNTVLFYIAHLYEITLQSGENIKKMNPERFENTNRIMTRLTQESPSFHKNMYSMASAKYGILLYFWICPLFITVGVCYKTLFVSTNYSSDFSDEHRMAVLLALAGATNLIVNAKTFLLSCSGHFTCLVIVGLFFLCVTVSAVFLALIYAPLLIWVVIAVCLGYPN